MASGTYLLFGSLDPYRRVVVDGYVFSPALEELPANWGQDLRPKVGDRSPKVWRVPVGGHSGLALHLRPAIKQHTGCPKAA